MASESEQERRETLADIVAEMRTRRREVKEAFGVRPDGVENMLDIWADRIEAAARREVVSKTETTTPGNATAHAMTLDEAIAHAEDVADRCDTLCGSEHRQLADWLKELRDVKRQPVGNAAAMREELVAVKKAIDGIGESSFDCDQTILMDALTQVCARLSARIERVLSAPVAERKGEAKNERH